MLLYEYVITLREEIKVFWTDFKFNSVSILFVSTRWILIASGLLNVSLLSPRSASVSTPSFYIFKLAETRVCVAVSER